MTRLLGISNDKLILLNFKTKQPVQSQPVSEICQWSGMGHDGLVLEFRGSKPWTILTPSVDNLKSVTAALWEVTDVGVKSLDSAHLQRDILDFGESRFIPRYVKQVVKPTPAHSLSKMLSK